MYHARGGAHRLARSLVSGGVFTSIELAGDALGVRARAVRFADELRGEVEAIRDAVAAAAPKRVLAAEWLDPVYCGGHWMPEMISLAGGVDPFGTPHEPSHPLTWETIAAADPDVIVLMPCGFHAPEVVARYREVSHAPQFRALRAVRQRNVFAVDATSFYSRPGPRLVEGARTLARILHPTRIAGSAAPCSVFKLEHDGHFAPWPSTAVG